MRFTAESGTSAQKSEPSWRAAMFDWLDRNLDEQTGWWRKGIAYPDRHQALGGGSEPLSGDFAQGPEVR